MKPEELLQLLETVPPERVRVVELHAVDSYVGLRLDKREFPKNNWFHYLGAIDYHNFFYFGGHNSFFDDSVRVCADEVDSVHVDYDELNPHRDIIVRIYLK